MIAIEEIDTFQLTDGLPHVIVRIRDSEGSIGFGECWWGIPTPSDPKRGGAPIAGRPRLVARRRLPAIFFQLRIF